MKLPKIIGAKFVAVVAIIFALTKAVPDIWKAPTLLVVGTVTILLLGAVFVLRNRTWAAVLLAAWAFITIFNDIILAIPKFQGYKSGLLDEYEAFAPYISFMMISFMLIETLLLACLVYYGLYKVSLAHKG